MRTVGKAKKPSLTSKELVELAARTLLAHKGQDLLVLDVKNLSSLGDYFLICSGGSKRHVQALAEHLQGTLKQVGAKPLGLEGLDEGHWVLLDYVDVVIHLFIKPLREFYDLEGLWVEANRVPVEDLSTDQMQGRSGT
ncbi:MAG: ribosome silencing factor [Thermodesulfobacteriota bacterium]